MSGTTRQGFHVLLASDDSESARHAEAWLSLVRWPLPCIVDIVCVARHSITRLGWSVETERSSVSQAIGRLRESELMAAERIANEVGLRLQAAGLTTRAWARQGDVAAEILATIDLGRPDLVAIGPRGRSGLAHLLLGSVSRQVVAESRSPVLIAREPAHDHGPFPQSVLVLVDGTSAATAAIDWLVASGCAAQAKTTLLGLLGVVPGVEFDEPDLVSQVAESLRVDATAMLDGLSERLVDQGYEVDVMLEDGHPHEVTMEAAKRIEPDLLVVARPSGRRARDPFAEKIARYAIGPSAKTSVLVIPEP